jgi:hypothetical protein
MYRGRLVECNLNLLALWNQTVKVAMEIEKIYKHFIDIFLPNAIHATPLELPLSISFSQTLGTATSTLD